MSVTNVLWVKFVFGNFSFCYITLVVFGSIALEILISVFYWPKKFWLNNKKHFFLIDFTPKAILLEIKHLYFRGVFFGIDFRFSNRFRK